VKIVHVTPRECLALFLPQQTPSPFRRTSSPFAWTTDFIFLKELTGVVWHSLRPNRPFAFPSLPAAMLFKLAFRWKFPAAYPTRYCIIAPAVPFPSYTLLRFASLLLPLPPSRCHLYVETFFQDSVLDGLLQVWIASKNFSPPDEPPSGSDPLFPLFLRFSPFSSLLPVCRTPKRKWHPSN